jgi:hypothetical protein
MSKRPKVITEEQLIAAAEHLSTSREQFINQMRMIAEMFVAFQERLRAFEDYLDARDRHINAGIQLQSTVSESLERLVNLLTENTVALNENTERLDKFLTKFETYFGTDRGLELEN